MTLAPQDYRKTAWIHRRDTRANQPAANTVLPGTLYYVTDESVTERSNGTSWESYSDSGGGGTTIKNNYILIESESEPNSPDIILGSRGLQGIQGIPGISGLDGEDGRDGIPGIQGIKGDTGSTGTTGSAGKQGIPGLDGKDGDENIWSLVSPHKQTIEITLTTTGNIDDLNFGNADLIRMNNASLSTIRGLRAGTPGQKVTIVSIGADQVNFAHQNTNSAAENRLINYVTSGITPLAAGIGTATYQYDGTTARWRLVSHNQGTFISIPFNAGDYTGSGSMTWTVDAGDVATYAYFLNGRVMSVAVFNTLTSVGGTPDYFLQILLPNGYTIAATAIIPCQVIEIALYSTGLMIANIAVSTTQVLFVKDFVATPWAASTNQTAIRGSLSFSIN